MGQSNSSQEGKLQVVEIQSENQGKLKTEILWEEEFGKLSVSPCNADIFL